MDKKQILIRGISYDSYTEAAKALGLTKSAVQTAVRRGSVDTLGMGITPPRIKPGQQLAAKPISIRGVTYPSRSIAAEVLGVTAGTVSNAERRGSLSTVGTGERREYRKRG